MNACCSDNQAYQKPIWHDGLVHTCWGDAVQEKELQECTFSPKIKTMPSYIHRIAKTRSIGANTSRSSAKYAERAAQRTREWV